MKKISLILVCLLLTACYSADSEYVSKLGIDLATEKCANLGGLAGMTESTFAIRTNQEVRIVAISADCGTAKISFAFKINPNGLLLSK